MRNFLFHTAIGYVFPDEIQKNSPDSHPQNNTNTENSNSKSKSPDQDWQFVIPVPGPGERSTEDRVDTDNFEFEANKDGFVSVSEHEAMNANGSSSNEISQVSGIFPAARARLASLRDLGAKKIGALKLKLIENKIKSTERGKYAYF